LVYDALASAGLDSALDEILFAPPTVQASGAFSNFMDQLFAAIAAQQAETAQKEAVEAKVTRSAATIAAAQPTAATEAATTTAAVAAAAFASNTASAVPNSALESNVQALANQAQAAYTATSNTAIATESTNALLPLQQSLDEFIASAGGTTSTAALPTFLEALATNLHTVPSPLGNLVDSST
jgi:hypothetical protein